jgi:ATP10 protein
MTKRTKVIGASAAVVLLAVGAWFFMGCIGAGPVSNVVSRGNTKFPAMKGTNLQGVEIDIPMGLQGKRRLVAVAFLEEQQADVDTWVAHLDELRKNHPELSFYEIPMVYKGNVFFRFWLNNGMRAGIPDEQKRRSTITVYTDVESFLKEIGATSNRQIQVFVLDENGVIRGRASGPFSPENAAALFSSNQ